MFTIDVSGSYKGAYAVTTDDPYALYSLGIKVTEDGTLVEIEKALDTCRLLSSVGEVRLTEEALSRLARDNDESDISYPSLTTSKTPKTFQKKGFHRSDGLEAYVYVYSTGTGKTLMGTMEICRALDTGLADIAIVVPSAPLLSQWEEALTEDTNLDVVSVGRRRSKVKRMEMYAEPHDVYIVNYDKFAIADDAKALEKLCKNKSVILVLDETHKIKHRTSNNKAIKKFRNHVRPVKVVGLSATPIESSLLDWYNQMRVFSPDVYGTVRDFEDRYTVGHGERDIFGRYLGYCNFDDCRLRSSHMVSFADKTSDPTIAAEFPEESEVVIPVELSHFERKLYDQMVGYGKSLGEERNGAIFMQYLQRLCNAPETLLESESSDEQGRALIEIAGKYASHLEKSGESAKMARLEALVEELMEGAGKVVVFAHYTHLCLEQLERRLSRWSPLMYHGETGNKDEVIRAFKEDPSRRLLLLSDAAAEGFNLPQASSLIHYDTPTQYSKYIQRSGRISRIDSPFASIGVYRFVTRDTVEERIEALMEQRRQLAESMGFLSEEESAYLKIDEDDMTAGYGYLLGF